MGKTLLQNLAPSPPPPATIPAFRGNLRAALANGFLSSSLQAMKTFDEQSGD
jgi:hypothetical protein